jgi:hypothetical protein
MINTGQGKILNVASFCRALLRHKSFCAFLFRALHCELKPPGITGARGCPHRLPGTNVSKTMVVPGMLNKLTL